MQDGKYKMPQSATTTNTVSGKYTIPSGAIDALKKKEPTAPLPSESPSLVGKQPSQGDLSAHDAVYNPTNTSGQVVPEQPENTPGISKFEPTKFKVIVGAKPNVDELLAAWGADATKAVTSAKENEDKFAAQLPNLPIGGAKPDVYRPKDKNAEAYVKGMENLTLSEKKSLIKANPGEKPLEQTGLNEVNLAELGKEKEKFDIVRQDPVLATVVDFVDQTLTGGAISRAFDETAGGAANLLAKGAINGTSDVLNSLGGANTMVTDFLNNFVKVDAPKESIYEKDKKVGYFSSDNIFKSAGSYLKGQNENWNPTFLNNELLSSTIEGVGSILPMMVAMEFMPHIGKAPSLARGLAPQSAEQMALASKAIPTAEVISGTYVPKISTYIGSTSFFSAYDQARSQGIAPSEALSAAIIEGGKGMLTGALFEGGGKLSGYTSKLLFEKTGDATLSTLGGVGVNALSFPAAEGTMASLTGEEYTGKQAVTSAVLGAALSGKHIGDALSGRAIDSYWKSDYYQVKQLKKMFEGITPTEKESFRADVIKLREDASTEADPIKKNQKLATANILDKVMDVVVVDKVVVEHAKSIKEMIEADTEMDVPTKEFLVRRIDESVAAEDPNYVQAKILTEKISILQRNIDENLANKAKSPFTVKAQNETFELQKKEMEKEISDFYLKKPSVEKVFQSEGVAEASPKNKAEYRDALIQVVGYDPLSAKVHSELADMRANAWSKETGKKSADWYGETINKIRNEASYIKDMIDSGKARTESEAKSILNSKGTQEGMGQEKLGAIEFDAQNKAIITAFKGANTSTLAHEALGHTYFQQRLYEHGAGTNKYATSVLESVLSDYNASKGTKVSIKDIMPGGKEYANVHEHFAVGFENWLKEGQKSKDPVQQAVFNDFKKWMLQVYSAIGGKTDTSKGMSDLYKEMLGVEPTEKVVTEMLAEIKPEPILAKNEKETLQTEDKVVPVKSEQPATLEPVVAPDVATKTVVTKVKKEVPNAIKKGIKPESDISKHQGVAQGQPKTGKGKGRERDAEVKQTNPSDSNVVGGKEEKVVPNKEGSKVIASVKGTGINLDVPVSIAGTFPKKAFTTEKAARTYVELVKSAYKKNNPDLFQSKKDENKSVKTQNFFSDVVTGKSEKFIPKKPWEPILELSGKESVFLKIYNKFNGKFDAHIASSIPAFRDVQIKVGTAILKMFKGKSALLYDIGGSEGGFAKAITSASGGKIKSINLDANKDMQDVHNSLPVKGSEFVKEAFYEGFDNLGDLIVRHDPKRKADIVHESMTFQFIMDSRGEFIKEVKDSYLKKGGLFITEEKLFPESESQWAANEKMKDTEFKTQYFDSSQISVKAEEVLTGMRENQATYSDYIKGLKENFKYVQEYWDGGNFKGVVASDNGKLVSDFVKNVGVTDTKYSEKNIKSNATVGDLEYTKDATGYAKKMSEAKASLKENGMSVDVYEQSEYDKIAKEGGIFVYSKDGTSMSVLKGDGEMLSSVKNANSTKKNVSVAMLNLRKSLGGMFMDNYDIYLTKQYEKAGFKVAARVPFNEEYAPDGWNAEGSPLKGKPDVVIMLREDLLTGPEKMFKKSEYEDAQKYVKDIVATAVSEGRAAYPRDLIPATELFASANPGIGKRTESKVSAVRATINQRVQDLNKEFFGSETPESKDIKAKPGAFSRAVKKTTGYNLGGLSRMQNVGWTDFVQSNGDKVAGAVGKMMGGKYAVLRGSARFVDGLMANVAKTVKEVGQGELMGGSIDTAKETVRRIAGNLYESLLGNRESLSRIDRVLDPEFFNKKTRSEYEQYLKDNLSEKEFEDKDPAEIDAMYESLKESAGWDRDGLSEYTDYLKASLDPVDFSALTPAKIASDFKDMQDNKTAGYLKFGHHDLTTADLLPNELAVYNMTRKLFDLVHDMNYVLKLDDITYDKYKGKYSARFYDKYEVPEEISSEIEALSTKMELGGFKQRGVLDDWKMQHKLQDPIYAVSKRFGQALSNEAIHNYASWIVKESPEHISKTEKAGFTLMGKGYGPLSGKYLRLDVAESFKGIKFANEYFNAIYKGFKGYSSFAPRLWLKKGVTVYRPDVNLGNITGNFVFASLIGINPMRLAGNMKYAIEQEQSYGDIYRFLLKKGILNPGSTLDDLKKASIVIENDIYGKTDPLTLAGRLKNADGAWTKFYQNVDQWSKIAAFKSLVDIGIPPDKAAAKVADGFQNFRRIGRIYDFASKTPVVGPPFAKFSGDLLRIMKSATMKNPLNLAIFFGTMKMLGNLTSQYIGQETEEEMRIRTSRTGVPKIPMFKALGGAIPLEFKLGKNAVNLARFLSPIYGMDMSDKNDYMGAFMRLSPYNFATEDNPNTVKLAFYKLISSDILTAPVMGIAFDTDWLGKSVSDPSVTEFRPVSNLTESQKLENYARFAMRGWVPGYGQLLDDMANIYQTMDPKTGTGTDKYGRQKSYAMALVRYLGYNAQVFDDAKYQSVVEKAIIKEAKGIEETLNALTYAKNVFEGRTKGDAMTKEQYARKVNVILARQNAFIASAKAKIKENIKTVPLKNVGDVINQINSHNKIATLLGLPESVSTGSGIGIRSEQNIGVKSSGSIGVKQERSLGVKK